MESWTTLLALITCRVMWLAIPISVTYVMIHLLRKLDDKWQAEISQ
jgi:hypothetical protein